MKTLRKWEGQGKDNGVDCMHHEDVQMGRGGGGGGGERERERERKRER